MAYIVQAPAPLNLQGVQGDPFIVTLDITLTNADNESIPWSDVTSITPIVTGVPPYFTSIIPLEEAVPNVSTSTNVVILEWTANQTALFAGLQSTNWSLSSTISGTGPLTLLAGSIAMTPSTVPGSSNSTTADLSVLVGTATASVAVTVGGGGGGGGSGFDFTGDGSPQGVVTANVGQNYYDTTNAALYFKGYGDATNTGWLMGVGTSPDAEWGNPGQPGIGWTLLPTTENSAALWSVIDANQYYIISDVAGARWTQNGFYYWTGATDGQQGMYWEVGARGQAGMELDSSGALAVFGPLLVEGDQAVTAILFFPNPMTLPLTVVTGTNDEFVFDGPNGSETFTVAAGTYTTASDLATAIEEATGSHANEAFSTLVIVTTTNAAGDLSYYFVFDAPSTGTTYNSYAIIPGSHDITSALGLNGEQAFMGGATGTRISTFASPLIINGVTYFAHAGNPNSAVTANAEGDICVDTTTPALWQATASGDSSWEVLAGGNTFEEINIANNSVTEHGHLAQKSNGELVWAFNVNPLDDSIDNDAVGVWKLSVEGGGAMDYNGWDFQYSAPNDTWEGVGVLAIEPDGSIINNYNGGGILTDHVVTGGFEVNTVHVFTYAGNPNGNVSSINQGDLIFDHSTPAIWTATAASSSSAWVRIAPTPDTGAVTLTANNPNQAATYAYVEVGPLLSSGNYPYASQAPAYMSDWLPLNIINSGEAIQVSMTNTLLATLPDAVDISGTIVVWDLAGTNLISCTFAATVANGESTASMALAQTQLIGTDLSLTDGNAQITSAAGGIYNVLINCSAEWD